MRTNGIPASDIAYLLKRVVAGEITPSLIGPSWTEVYAGNVQFAIEKYRVVIFNDCDVLDYVDSAYRGGKSGDHNEWYKNGGDPVKMLTSIERRTLLKILREVTK